MKDPGLSAKQRNDRPATVGPPGNSNTETCQTGSSKRVFMFGGVSSPAQSLLDDLWELDVSAVDFENSMDELPGAVWTRLVLKGIVS